MGNDHTCVFNAVVQGSHIFVTDFSSSKTRSVEAIERELAEAKQEAEAQRISAEIKAANEAKAEARRGFLVDLRYKAEATMFLLQHIDFMEKGVPNFTGTFSSTSVKQHLADMRALSKSLGYGIVVTASGALSLVKL